MLKCVFIAYAFQIIPELPTLNRAVGTIYIYHLPRQNCTFRKYQAVDEKIVCNYDFDIVD